MISRNATRNLSSRLSTRGATAFVSAPPELKLSSYLAKSSRPVPYIPDDPQLVFAAKNLRDPVRRKLGPRDGKVVRRYGTHRLSSAVGHNTLIILNDGRKDPLRKAKRPRLGKQSCRIGRKTDGVIVASQDGEFECLVLCPKIEEPLP